LESAAKLPYVHVNRVEFLTKNLSKVCTETQIQTAISKGTLHANIPIETLDSLANAVINAETTKVSLISAAAGIPGGFAMAATIPADIAQFYGFVIRTAQELAYIYGWDEIATESPELDTKTESQLILFIGVMSGVCAANMAVAKLFGEATMKSVAKKVAAKALTKTWYYPIAKKVAALLGKNLVKASFAKGISKAVPVIGGIFSGGLTFATFKPMSCKLRKHLSKLAHMTPEEFDQYQDEIVIDVEDISEEIIDTDCPEVETHYWVCDCESQNKGKFCSNCGKQKPAGIPQYKCDKCGWEPIDNTQPPNFCPACGDVFDEGDIVLV